MFIWATVLFYRHVRAARRTRWRSTSSASSGCGRSQHSEGRAEINELHVPLGQADQADDDLGGRDPQLLHPRVPDEAGRAAGPLHLDVVRADQGRALPPVLRRVLRHEPLGDDRLGRRSWSRPSSSSGSRRRGPARRWPTRASSCSSSTIAPAATGAARSSMPPGSRASTAGRSRSSRATTSGSPWPTSGTSATRSSCPRRRSSPATSR